MRAALVWGYLSALVRDLFVTVFQSVKESKNKNNIFFL